MKIALPAAILTPTELGSVGAPQHHCNFISLYFLLQLKSVGPKLVPFLKTVAVFFVLFGETSSVTFFCCMIKCLPVLMLIHFVLLDGVNMTEAYAYTRKIFTGLIFSVIGDALLGKYDEIFNTPTPIFLKFC